MSAINGYYSIVQYCPDPSRQEFVNMGVALYSPITKQVKVQFASDNRRLSQVFGKQDLRLINRMKKAIEENLKRQFFASAKELEAFIARNANALQLSPLRSVKIFEVEQDLSKLMDRLVEEGPDRKPRMQKALGQKLVEAGVEKFVHKQVNIALPAFEQSIRVPYAYRNGRYNLITPVEFSADVHDIFSKAGEKAIEGQELFDSPDPELGNLHLVVVAKFADETQEHARAKVERIFEQHHVAMHSFENLSPLVDDIRKSAIEHGLLSISEQ
jgi:hypothetical protein